MSFYRYTAKNSFGETMKGKVEAQSIQQASGLLTSRGLLVITLNPLVEDSLASLKARLFGIKIDDIVNFTRQLATMVTAGLPLATALSILVRQSKEEMSRMVAGLLQEVEGGSSFAKALEKQKENFSRIYIQLVFAGETGGVLDTILERLADNMEKQKEFRAKTKGALIYPIIVVIAMIVVGIIMMIFVIPKLTEMYRDFGAELPLATRILIGISEFLSKAWWAFLIAVVGGVFGFRKWYLTRPGKLAIDRFIMKLPIVGELTQKMVLTEFARTLSLLLSAGISLLQALEIVTDGVENIIYREALEKATDQVEKGVSLSEALGHFDDIFPPILFQMIRVGEETGKLDSVLQKLSQYFESETEHAVKNLTTAIEPMIMIVLGLGVGAMVIAIIMPIYNLTSQF